MNISSVAAVCSYGLRDTVAAVCSYGLRDTVAAVCSYGLTDTFVNKGSMQLCNSDLIASTIKSLEM